MWTLMSGLGLNRNDENGQRGATQQLTSPSDVDCEITKARPVGAIRKTVGPIPTTGDAVAQVLLQEHAARR
jgi:hypothetical protein